MLFDEQNSYFDTKTNEYSEAIDIDNKINNNEYFLDIDTLNVYNYRTSNKIDTLEEGFYKGNMFVNTYDKYKNHLYKVVVSGEKDKLLLIIQMHMFALNDLNLYLDLNPNDKTLIEKQDSSINYVKLILSIIGFIWELILIVILAIDLVKLMGIDSKYVKELKRILKTYDSVIVNVKEIKFDKNQNIMYVDKFEELLDAQLELRIPILYCNVSNKESMFAVKHNKDVFVFKMKSTLYENDKTKKKNVVKNEK